MPTWLEERLGLLLFLAAAAVIIGGIVLIMRVAAQERRSDSALQTYNNLRAGIWITIGTLILGVAVSLSVTILVGAAFDSILQASWSPEDYDELLALRLLVDLIIGLIPAVPLFWFGLFEIQPGQKAYLKILGVPFGRLGAGYGWRLPLLMQVVLVQTQAHENQSDGAEEFVTGNGIEMFLKTGITVVTMDPLLVQGIAGGDIDAYLTTERQAAVRKYIASKRVDIVLAPDQATDLRSLEAFFNQIKEMKGDIAAEGAESIRLETNKRIGEFGLYCTQVQLEQILFNDSLEKSAQRFFNEMMEAVGLVQDAVNKASVIKELNERTLKDVGLTIDDLSRDEKLAMLRRAIAFSLAAEGQGNYNFHDFGGMPPNGVIVNTAQPPQGGTPNG